MRKLVYLFGFCAMLILTACPEDFGDSITVKNDSDHTLAVYIRVDKKGAIYPDTTLPLNNETFIIEKRDIRGADFYYFPDIHGDTLRVFILDQDTINKYTWEKIRSDYKILKRYDLLYSDLTKIKWEITYP